MKADSLPILTVLQHGGDVHYVLPLFQREYTWEEPQWQTLLDDLFSIYQEAGDGRQIEHFMGSLVVISDGFRNGLVPVFRLVDGQQRLTTISLMLCALGRLTRETHPNLASMIDRLLLNQSQTGDLRLKLYPTTKYGDRAAYTAILEGTPEPPTVSRIARAYEYLSRELQSRISRQGVDPEKLCTVIGTCLQVVLIQLDTAESPYKIFESLNAKGKPLSQADLVRNYIAMRVPATAQAALYEQHWARIEGRLQEQQIVGRSGLGELTAFLRHYLAMHSGILVNEAHVYARFRDRMEREFTSVQSLIDELAVLHRFAVHYDRLLRPEQEANLAVRTALKRLNVLEVSTAYPFLLALYEAWSARLLSDPCFIEALTILENYLVRRYLTGASVSYVNRSLPVLWRDIDKDRFAASLREQLASRHYPGDDQIRHAIQMRPFYNTRAQSREKAILVLETVNRRLYAGMGGYGVLDGAATLEHILPQNPSDEWKSELGPEWEQVHRELVHTLGNLTLVTQEWNSSLSNAPFAFKRQKLASHALRLNSHYFCSGIPDWDDRAIRQRGEFLTEQILAHWPSFAAPSRVSSGQAGAEPAVRRDWDAGVLLAELEARAPSKAADVARQILEWVEPRVTRVWWSTNSYDGSFVPFVDHKGQRHQLFAVRSSGGVEVYFQWYQNKPPFQEETKRVELLQRLNDIEGVQIPQDAIQRRPVILLETLASGSATQQFFKTFEWFIEQIRSS